MDAAYVLRQSLGLEQYSHNQLQIDKIIDYGLESKTEQMAFDRLLSAQYSLESICISLEQSILREDLTGFNMEYVNHAVGAIANQFNISAEEYTVSVEQYGEDPVQLGYISMERIGGIVGAIGDNIGALLRRGAVRLTLIFSTLNDTVRSVSEKARKIKDSVRGVQVSSGIPIDFGRGVGASLTLQGESVDGTKFTKNLKETSGVVVNILNAYSDSGVLNAFMTGVVNALNENGHQMSKKEFVQFFNNAKKIMTHQGHEKTDGIKGSVVNMATQPLLGFTTANMSYPEESVIADLLKNDDFTDRASSSRKVDYREIHGAWGKTWRIVLAIILIGLANSNSQHNARASTTTYGRAGQDTATAWGEDMAVNAFKGSTRTKYASPAEIMMIATKLRLIEDRHGSPKIVSMDHKAIEDTCDIVMQFANDLQKYAGNLPARERIVKSIDMFAKSQGDNTMASSTRWFVRDWLQHMVSFEADTLAYSVRLMNDSLKYAQASINP